MRYDVLSDDELNKQRNSLSEGFVDWTVEKAEDWISQSSGREMIKLGLRVIDEHGVSGFVTDYLSVSWKIKQFLESSGKVDLYRTGELEADFCFSLSGKGRIKKEFYTDKNGNQKSSFKIIEYIKPGKVESHTHHKQQAIKAAQVVEDDDDDVPF